MKCMQVSRKPVIKNYFIFGNGKHFIDDPLTLETHLHEVESTESFWQWQRIISISTGSETYLVKKSCHDKKPDEILHNTFIICLILMNYLMEFYFIGFVNAHLPGCFCPWTFRLNIGLNTSPSDSFVSYLNSHLGYSAGEFQALQLIVLAVFGAVD